MKSVLHWLPIALLACFSLLLAYMQRDRALRGENDFVSFYVAGELVGTPDLYSRPANERAIQSVLGFSMENVTYIRPPFYAAFYAPLSKLPYLWAYGIYSLITLSCVLWFVIRFSQECAALPFYAAMSVPIVGAICGGQDTPLLLAIVGGGILLMRANKQFLAGLLLCLLSIKFHLFLFVPVLLVMKKRWAMLRGAGVGLAALAALSLATGSFDSIERYIATLRDPWINPSATIMPNLHGLAAVLHGGLALELVLAAMMIGIFLREVRRRDDFEYLLAISLVCGLLVSFHSGVPDDVLLLPVFVILARPGWNPKLGAVAGLILTPIPYFMVLSGAPYSAALPVALLALLGLVSALPVASAKVAAVADQPQVA